MQEALGLTTAEIQAMATDVGAGLGHIVLIGIPVAALWVFAPHLRDLFKLIAK